MKAKIIAVLSAAALLGSTAAHAEDLKLPGSTLGKQASKGLQPKINPQNVIGPAITPECPYIGLSCGALLRIARSNYRSLYRQGLALRRGGATEAIVRNWLEDKMCKAAAP